jgi:hypothetical protein
MLRHTVYQKFLMIHNAFSDLNKVSMLMIKIGLVLSLILTIISLIAYKSYNINGFSFYNEFLMQTGLKTSAVILLEVFVGSLLGDYLIKKGSNS